MPSDKMPGGYSQAGSCRWSSEIELLLACARHDLAEPHIERGKRALASGIDGSRLMAFARAHRLVPLLNTHARHFPLPAETLAQLRAHAATVARRSLRLSAELVGLLRTFAAEGLPMMPLKGPMLAQHVYGSVALRDFDDLDVLINPDDVCRARDLLRNEGFLPADGLLSGGNHRAHDYAHTLSFKSPTSGVRLELHTSLLKGARPGRHSLDGLETVVSSFMGVPAATLRPGPMLAYLCEHGASHAWSRLEWLATTAGFARSSPGGWDSADEASRRWGSGSRVRAAAFLAGMLLDGRPSIAIPPTTRSARVACDTVIRKLALAPGLSHASSAERVVYLLRTDQSWRVRLRRLRILLLMPQPSDRRLFALPHAVRAFYPVLRPLRLLGRVVARPFQNRNGRGTVPH